MKYSLDSIESRELFPGLDAQFIHSQTMTVSIVKIKEGAIVPEHKHVHEQITIMREGNLKINLQGEEHLLTPGDVLVIPSNELHSAKALSNSRVIDIFNPVREDYK